MARKNDKKNSERPSITRSDIVQKNISFPDSIRLDPIRLPRPTILRESPIFDISSQYTYTLPYPRDVIRAHVKPSHGQLSYPEHQGNRRLGDTNLDSVNDELFTHVASSASATDVNQIMAVDRMLLAAPENREDQPRTMQIIPQDIPRESPVPQPTQEVTLVTTSTTPPPVANNDVSVMNTQQTMNARALCSNPFLGYQRFAFIITKYPAMAMAMVALWNVKGRGEDMPKSTTEQCAFYSALTTAGIVLVSQIFLHTNHHYSYKKARIMSYLYHLAMVVAFCAAVTCVVFAATNTYHFRETTETFDCPYANSTMCYSNQERITHQAVLVGGGGMIILLALAVFTYGGLGLSLMKNRLADEYEKEARLSAYENQAFLN